MDLPSWILTSPVSLWILAYCTLQEQFGPHGRMWKSKYRANIWADISVAIYLKHETIGSNWLVVLLLLTIHLLISALEGHHLKFFYLKPQIPNFSKLGKMTDDNNLCQSKYCLSSPKHWQVNGDTNHSCIDNLLTAKNSMDLLNRETQFKNIYRKVYWKPCEANHRSLSSRIKHAQPLPFGQNVLLENHPFRKFTKFVRTPKWTVHCE